MATIFKTPYKRKDATGKKVIVYGSDGEPVMHPKWRTTIFDHKGKRKTFTLTTSKQQSQKQADMLELKEKEIKNGLRAAPEADKRKVIRDFNEVFDEYMSWGKVQGGRKGLPWDDEHAFKKERDIIFWRAALKLKVLDDAIDILPRVEKECQKMVEVGNSGKTISNKVQNLHALLLWCKKRKYLTEDPLSEMGKFDTEPTFIRRAMTLNEFNALLIGCAPHRRLLYEVAACTGLRENELRQLEPKHLDQKNCAIKIDRMVDKARKARLQPIPATLMERLTAFVKTGEARRIYARIYKRQGDRPNRKQPPTNPLLYVPTNSATMLKKDLEAAGIPFETPEGRLDFHALRTAYVNFLIDVGASPKTTQSLARHATLEMTMNVYGRAREDYRRDAVEALGEMLLSASDGLEVQESSKQNYRISTEPRGNPEKLKDATLDNTGVASINDWCRRQDMA